MVGMAVKNTKTDVACLQWRQEEEEEEKKILSWMFLSLPVGWPVQRYGGDKSVLVKGREEEEEEEEEEELCIISRNSLVTPVEVVGAEKVAKQQRSAACTFTHCVSAERVSCALPKQCSLSLYTYRISSNSSRAVY